MQLITFLVDSAGLDAEAKVKKKTEKVFSIIDLKYQEEEKDNTKNT